MRNDEAIGSGAYNGILGIYKNEGGYSSQVMSIVDNFGRRSRIERGVFQILLTKKKEEVVETEGMALIEAEELIEEIERY